MRRKKILSEGDIDAALAEIAIAAKGVKTMLVGGVALHWYGSDRLTSDIDIVAAKRIQLPEEKALSFGGYSSHTSRNVPVDVILRDDDFSDVYAEALDHAIKTPEIPIPIISLNYAVVMKMIAHRPKDLADLDTIFRTEEFDEKIARKLVKRLLGAYALNDFDSMLQESRWRHK